jgi:phage shock protein A
VALRQKINEAIDYEDMLTARVQEFQTEVERLDQQADRAVALGEEDRARTLLVQRERAVQRLTMAESDLREHRFVTQELIQRVNQLEAVVAEIPDAQPVSEQPVEAGENNLAAVLRQAREQLVRESARNTGETPDKSGTEADLEQRRRRLSKPSP